VPSKGKKQNKKDFFSSSDHFLWIRDNEIHIFGFTKPKISPESK